MLDNQLKLETVYKNVSNFDHKQFLDGAKKAFEIIITAFNNGDKKTLKNLVSQDVYNAFEKYKENEEVKNRTDNKHIKKYIQDTMYC